MWYLTDVAWRSTYFTTQKCCVSPISSAQSATSMQPESLWVQWVAHFLLQLSLCSRWIYKFVRGNLSSGNHFPWEYFKGSWVGEIAWGGSDLGWSRFLIKRNHSLRYPTLMSGVILLSNRVRRSQELSYLQRDETFPYGSHLLVSIEWNEHLTSHPPHFCLALTLYQSSMHRQQEVGLS